MGKGKGKERKEEKEGEKEKGSYGGRRGGSFGVSDFYRR